METAPSCLQLVRGCSGSGAAFHALRASSHAAALVGTTPASLRAFLAVRHLMLCALVTTRLAYVGAQLAYCTRHFTAARHVRRR